MKKILLVFSCLLSISILIKGQLVNNEPLSERQTGYNIDARLDPVTKIVYGKMQAFWVNKTSETVKDIQLHLYLNAFRNNKSTFFKESGGSPGKKETDPGWININIINDKYGNDLLPLMRFISPDDDNEEDMTVTEIVLPQPVSPGDTVVLNVDFESKLPSDIIRTGFTDDYYFVAQWFPKFGVYEPAGMRFSSRAGWNCHQFHRNSEFYSNHSVYNVKITVPKEYVVGTGGLLLDEKVTDDGNKTLTYRAEDIVDFAWTAWPGYAVFTDKWEHVNITLLLPEERKNQVTRQMGAVKNALEYLTENVGPYPWTHLTFVDPPAKGSGAGGMEYTTLFTSTSFNLVPDFFRLPEMVTIHEFGHAYFMGILASNEFEEPWLDEGVNSFWEARIVDHYYGENAGFLYLPWLKFADKSMSRLSYVTSGSKQASTNSEYSWNYPHRTYAMMSYNKAAVILQTLMGITGEKAMNEIFQEYYKKWAFKHPSAQDFINVANEVVSKNYVDKLGPDLNWFFSQTLYGTGICDYKVLGFRNKKIYTQKDKMPGNDSLTKTDNSSDSLYNSIVELERIGEVMLPVEVLVHFKNGDEVMEFWDGKSRTKDFTYIGSRTIQWVKIDPDYKIPMDVNYINNSKTEDPDRVPVRRMTNKMISFMQFFLNLILI